MAITIEQVKDLRDKTGAGMGDCKKALALHDGDMQAAIEHLRKSGAASAAKRADRSSNEGLILTRTSAEGKIGAIVEINCETDFVARNDEFMAFSTAVLDVVFNNNPASVEVALAAASGDGTLNDHFNETLAKFSERILIKRFERIETDGYLVDYTHVGNKLGVLLEFNQAPANDEAEAKFRDIAMQIAAMNPGYVRREEVDNATLEKEQEIYRAQAIEQGKPENIADKIAQGRTEKFYQENCLLEQTFVKDSGKTVTDVLKEVSGGSDLTIRSFRRYLLGDEEEASTN